MISKVAAPNLSAVIAGLDPAIHRLELKRFFSMDARVKPGHDAADSHSSYLAGDGRA
jgi:hypothetical protein